MADRPTAEPQVLRCTCLCPESTHTGPGGHCTKSACRDEPCTPMSEWLKEQQAEQRPTASTVTDDQLEALYAELAEATDAVKEAREMTERGHAEVKRAQEVMGRTQARAEGAEQQLAQMRGTLAEVLAEFVHDTHTGRTAV